MFVVLVLLWVVCAIGAGLFAQAKGRSVGWFALAGFLLGPVGLLWAAFATPAGELSRRELRWEAEQEQARYEAEKARRPSRLGDLPKMRWSDDESKGS